ncbi:MAG: hypothetical protein GX605_02720 [Chloroflexi bacterium]|nr:hypothetical protein [Chloroflexota bacterium]
MELLIELLTESRMSLAQTFMLAVLLLFIPALLFFRARARSGRGPSLRPIAGFRRLHDFVGLAAETGQPVSVSLGTGSVYQGAAAETLAALDVLDYLGEQAAAHGSKTLVTTGDATTLLAAQGALRGAYAAQGVLAEYDPLSARWVAPDAAAYAAGVGDLLRHEPLAASVLAGRFDDEYLLLGEAGRQAGVGQVAGAAQPTVLPFVHATSDCPVLGEELFAAGAYLKGQPAHVGSLMAQDWMRILLILVIVGGIVAKTLLA